MLDIAAQERRNREAAEIFPRWAAEGFPVDPRVVVMDKPANCKRAWQAHLAVLRRTEYHSDKGLNNNRPAVEPA